MTASPYSRDADSVPVRDAETLRRGGRGVTQPFNLAFNTDGKRQILECTEILRLLPGRRLVCFGIWEHSRSVVAKVYLDPRRARRHFQRETRGIAALQSAGIPTPAVLYKGTLADGRTPLLLTRRIANARSLSDALASADGPGTNRLLASMIECLAQMHAAGLSQRDAHPGNFLLVHDDVLVIDGADVRRHGARPLPRSASIANLGLFLAQIYPALEDLIPGLIVKYSRLRGWSPSPAFTRRVEKAVRRWSDWRERKFLQKSLRSCTAFVARKSWQCFKVCDRERHTPAMDRLLRDPDAAMASGTILKAGNSATVVKIHIDGRTLVVKRYNIKNLWHAFSRAIRPTRAFVSWRNAHRLRLMGISTPRPVALIEERSGILRKRAYFITDYINGQSAESLFNQNVIEPSCYTKPLIDLLCKFYLLRISHSDMKASNFIYYNGCFYVIDLDGMKKHRFNFNFRRALKKDINRLLKNWSDSEVSEYVHREIQKRIKFAGYPQNKS